MEQNEVQGIKISQLDELTSIQDNDVLASVDTSEIKTTKVKASTLKSYINKEVNNEIITIKNDYALKTSIPTKLSQLTEDSTHRLVTDTEKATWNNKVDKVEGKGLSTNDFTNELKSKLDGIEDNAQVNKIEKISLDGVEQEINEKEVNIKSYDINKYFYNALTYNEAKGNDLTFEDSIEFPLGKLDMDGKSEQDLSKMTYKCNGTETGDYYFTYEDTNYQFTMPSVTSSSILVFDTLTLKLSINDEEITTSNSNTGTLIELSATPNPDYPQEITSIEGDLEYVGYGSKNLLNATRNEYTSNGITLSADTSKIYINGTPSTNDKMHTTPFKIPKGTYTLSLELISGSITSGTGALFQLYKDYTFNKVNKKDIIIYNSNKKNYVTFNLNEDTNINLSIYARTSETFTNAVIQYQITKGESADYDFVPFIEPHTLTIPTNGQVFRKVGDVADKLIVDMKTGDYYKQGNIREVVFNGSENWIFNISVFTTRLIFKNINEIYGRGICNQYNQVIGLIGSLDYAFKLQAELFQIRNKDYSNTSSFKNYLKELYNSGNPVILDYVIETPTLEKLGTLTKEQLDMLVTFKGYNNVMINTNLGQADIDIEYVLDMKKYIDNKIAEISAQLI